jgi:hypothetical protein
VAECEPNGSHFTYFAKQAVNTAYRQPLIYRSSRLSQFVNSVTQIIGRILIF